MTARLFSALVAALALAGCADKVNILYQPLTFCVGVVGADGNVLVEEVLVFRLDSVINLTADEAVLWHGYFFVRPSDTRAATRAAQYLTDLPAPLRVAPGDTVRGPWILAIRVLDYERAGYVTSDGPTTVTVRFLPLKYDPTLGVAPSSRYLVFSGTTYLRGVDRTPCTLDRVRSLLAGPG